MQQEVVLTPQTVVSGKIGLKEPSGSTATYPFTTTLADIGVVLGDTTPSVPTDDEIKSAVQHDTANAVAIQKGNVNSAVAALGAKYTQINASKAADPSKLIRQALVKFFGDGGIPGHPIDSSKYTWSGDENGITLTYKTAPDGSHYVDVAGTAVWGS